MRIDFSFDGRAVVTRVVGRVRIAWPTRPHSRLLRPSRLNAKRRLTPCAGVCLLRASADAGHAVAPDDGGGVARVPGRRSTQRRQR